MSSIREANPSIKSGMKLFLMLAVSSIGDKPGHVVCKASYVIANSMEEAHKESMRYGIYATAREHYCSESHYQTGVIVDSAHRLVDEITEEDHARWVAAMVPDGSWTHMAI